MDFVELVRREGAEYFGFLVTDEGFLGPEVVNRGIAYHRSDINIEICYFHYKFGDHEVVTQLVAESEPGSWPVSVGLARLYTASGLGSTQDVPSSAGTRQATTKHLAQQAKALQRLMPVLTREHSQEMLRRTAGHPS
jgi:hypothetical protein